MLAAFFGIGTVPASAQASQRIVLSGYVAPRCWVSSDAVAVSTAAPRAGGLVRCSTGPAQIRVETRVEPGARGAARKVTVSPYL